MDTWQQSALADEIEDQAQVPVLSLAASASVRPSRQLGRPTLIQMGSNVSEQIRCISAIVHSYHWRRVIAIYEDDAYGGNAEMLTLLSEALQGVGSEIEYHLSLPPISSLSDPRGAVRPSRALEASEHTIQGFHCSSIIITDGYPFVPRSKADGFYGERLSLDSYR